MAQEFLGSFPPDVDGDTGERATLREVFRSTDEREVRLASRKATLEEETDRWAMLPAIIHGGNLALRGEAPEGLTWLLNGREWDGALDDRLAR